MPFNLGFGEVLIILIIVLLLFGAKRIPEIAGSLGKGINSFKRNLSEVEGSLREGTREGTREGVAVDPAPRRDPLQPGDHPAAARTDDVDRPEPKRLLN